MKKDILPLLKNSWIRFFIYLLLFFSLSFLYLLVYTHTVPVNEIIQTFQMIPYLNPDHPKVNNKYLEPNMIYIPPRNKFTDAAALFFTTHVTMGMISIIYDYIYGYPIRLFFVAVFLISFCGYLIYLLV